MEEKDPGQILIDITDILCKLNIPYYITGGMALLFWGRPRFTADVDMVIKLDYESVDNLYNALLMFGKASYIDKNMIKEALEREGEFNFIHGDSGIKVDFWVLKKKDIFEQGAFKRRTIKKFNDREIYLSSPEDLILSKLLWYEQGGSARNLDDIKSVLDVSGKELDMDYLRKWAKKLEVLETLNELL